MAKSGFAAAGRTDKRECLSVPDAEANVFKHIAAGTVRKGNVFELNVALNVFELDCIGFILNLGFCIEQLRETFKTGHAHCVLFRKCGKLAYRGNKR